MAMAKGRPIQYDRNASLHAALELFWRNGYKGTSLSDLCRHTKLSKSTLYASFGDKRTVFLLAIEAYSNSLLDALESQYAEATSPKSFIKKVLYDLASEASSKEDRRGCLVMNAATEFAQTDFDVAQIVKATLKKMQKIFSKALHEGQETQEIRKETEPEVMSLYLVNTIAGMKTMVKAGKSKASLIEIAELFLGQI